MKPNAFARQFVGASKATGSTGRMAVGLRAPCENRPDLFPRP